MKLVLLEDVTSSIATIENKLTKGSPVKESDFAELQAADIMPFLDKSSNKPKPTGVNETIVIEQYFKKLFGNNFDEVIKVYSLLTQSINIFGIDDNNLFVPYVSQLLHMNVEPQQGFCSLVLSFLKSKKISKQDMNKWLLEPTLYEKDAEDTQYKIETYLFLSKQNGAKEYNLRVDKGDGTYRFLEVNDLYEGSKFKSAAEIRDLLKDAQLAGENEADNQEQQTKADQDRAKQRQQDAENREDLNRAQQQLIKQLVSKCVQENPKVDSTKVRNAAEILIVNGDTEETLYNKVSEYLSNSEQGDNSEIVSAVVSRVMQKNPTLRIYDIKDVVQNLIQSDDTEQTLYNKVQKYLRKRSAHSSRTDDMNRPVTKSSSLSDRLVAALTAAGYNQEAVEETVYSLNLSNSTTFPDAISLALKLLK